MAEPAPCLAGPLGALILALCVYFVRRECRSLAMAAVIARENRELLVSWHITGRFARLPYSPIGICPAPPRSDVFLNTRSNGMTASVAIINSL